jgi:uncharacterized membrane protein
MGSLLNGGLPTVLQLQDLSSEAEKAEFEPHDLPPPDMIASIRSFLPGKSSDNMAHELEKSQPEPAAEKEMETNTWTGIRLRLCYD